MGEVEALISESVETDAFSRICPIFNVNRSSSGLKVAPPFQPAYNEHNLDILYCTQCCSDLFSTAVPAMHHSLDLSAK